MDIASGDFLTTRAAAVSMVAKSCKASGFVVVNRNNHDTKFTHYLRFWCERGRLHSNNKKPPPPADIPPPLPVTDTKAKSTKSQKKFHTRPTEASEC